MKPACEVDKIVLKSLNAFVNLSTRYTFDVVLSSSSLLLHAYTEFNGFKLGRPNDKRRKGTNSIFSHFHATEHYSYSFSPSIHAVFIADQPMIWPIKGKMWRKEKFHIPFVQGLLGFTEPMVVSLLLCAAGESIVTICNIAMGYVAEVWASIDFCFSCVDRNRSIPYEYFYGNSIFWLPLSSSARAEEPAHFDQFIWSICV